MDIGLLIIRAVVGVLLVGHGTQKLFGWFRGHGLDGTGEFLERLGYRPGRARAAFAGVGEAGGGLLLVLGFLTPLAAAALIGVMTNAIVSVHWPNGIWNTEGGLEFPLVIAAAAASVAFTGAGDLSVDGALDLGLSGAGWGTTAVAVGLLAAMTVLSTRQRDIVEIDEAELVRGEAEVDTSTSIDAGARR